MNREMYDAPEPVMGMEAPLSAAAKKPGIMELMRSVVFR
jgi:hypothetical protein